MTGAECDCCDRIPEWRPPHTEIKLCGWCHEDWHDGLISDDAKPDAECDCVEMA